MTMLIRASLLALAMGAGLTGPLAIDVDGHTVTDLAAPGPGCGPLLCRVDCPYFQPVTPDVQRLQSSLRRSASAYRLSIATLETMRK